jgi:large subunit ribosomal protein L10
MSKRVKSLIERDLGNKLKDVESVAVINPRGIDATKTNGIRRRLREKGLRMTVVKNTLVKRATAKSAIAGFEKLLDGPSAVIYGEGSISAVARLLMEEKKTDDKIELRGIFFDGEIYTGEKGVEQVSKLPTREEAIGQIIALVLSPGKNLAGAITGPGKKLASIIKAIEEKAEKSGGAGDGGGAGGAETAAAPAPAPTA